MRSPYCRYCPVRNTILESLENRKVYRREEAEVPLEAGEKKEIIRVLVSTFPLTLYGEPQVIVSVEDISDFRETERKLKESEKNLRITLESIGDAVISTDTQGEVVRMNPVAERLCGWQREAALGKSIDHILYFMNAETGEKVENPVEKVLTNGEIVGLANHTNSFQRREPNRSLWRFDPSRR